MYINYIHFLNLIRFFCETDQVSLCAACIIEHSGHIFVKIEHSGEDY